MHRHLLLLLLLAVPARAVSDREASEWHQLVASEDVEGLQKLHAADAAGINIPGNGEQTPLMFAVLSGKKKAVRALLDLGADITIGEQDGYTPMHGAGFQGRAEIAQMLIDHGLNPRDMHEDGYEPIHRACWGTEPRHFHTVQVLLKAGVPHNAKARNGKTPWDLVKHHKSSPVYKLFKKLHDDEKKAVRDEL